ncbi:enoyl-CoA hydratase/isomerase family protein [Halocatena halophila]|uniref:enoyl-CoA hydratase/isomerase family protein n=1 Tax=Halocatena halophila TaxID=2814576 RepID=UPI002ED2EA65
MTDSYETVQFERTDDGLGWIELDRPDALNTITTELLDELDAVIDRCESAESVRAIYLTGAGDRAFSAGADVQSSGVMGHRKGVEHSRRGQTVFGRLKATDLPVVAGIDGYCLGGGMELSMCADLRIASDRSEFGLPEHSLGLLPGWGGTQRLQQLLGESVAKQFVFTADRFSAERMYEFGYLYDLIEAESFEEDARSFAAEIAAGPPIAQRYSKRAMRAATPSPDAGLELEAQAFGHLLDTEDLAAGISAFVTDSDPEFEGK